MNKGWRTSMGRIRPGRCVLLLVLGLLSLSMLVGCNDDDDDGVESGGPATILGNVASFDSGSAFFVPSPPQGRLEQWVVGVRDFILPSAYGAVAGVTVSVSGTDISVTTDGGGYFTLTGVPPGRRELIFSYEGQSGILELDIPADATIELRDVTVIQGIVNVGEVLIHVPVPASSVGGSSSGDEDGSGDDEDEDDDDGDDDGDEDDDDD